MLLRVGGLWWRLNLFQMSNNLTIIHISRFINNNKWGEKTSRVNCFSKYILTRKSICCISKEQKQDSMSLHIDSQYAIHCLTSFLRFIFWWIMNGKKEKQVSSKEINLSRLKSGITWSFIVYHHSFPASLASLKINIPYILQRNAIIRGNLHIKSSLLGQSMFIKTFKLCRT